MKTKNVSNQVFSTNSRVIKDLLTQYKSTFYAFCELINNAIQANSKKIDIAVEYSKNEVLAAPIRSIRIRDNGDGVSISEFEKSILEIGTDVKKGGQGVGRFAALQLGSNIKIETVSFDKKKNVFTKVILPINSALFENKKLVDMKFPVENEILTGNANTYYQVEIKDLHHGQLGKVAKKNFIAKELLEENIRLALFERYPYEIFNDTVVFSVNRRKLTKSEFINNAPVRKVAQMNDTNGTSVQVEFFFYSVKLKDNKAKVFFQVENNGLKSVVNSYGYSSEWFTHDMGSWYIYIESPVFSYDLFSNFDMDELGNDRIDKIKSFVKQHITDFFVSINKTFETFTEKLKDSYPLYVSPNVATSETQKVVFEKFAFVAEQRFKLLEKDSKIKDILYPLMDKAIADGNILSILENMMKSDKQTTDKFKNLLDVTDMESVVHFTGEVAQKLQFLNFLFELTYGKISKHILERKQLHKIVEKQLWLFGEAYNGVPNMLWSDKNLRNIFDDLRSKFMVYEPSIADENLSEITGEGLNDITDLFFTNERPLDDGSREFMIVELKAPKCKISQKEIAQIKKYAYAVESSSSIPKHNAKYKLILISSDITAQAKSEIKSLATAYKTPFMIERKQDVDIEVYLMTWAEVINIQRSKLTYLSNQLKVKDQTVKQKFEEEYPTLINQKMRTTLTKLS